MGELYLVRHGQANSGATTEEDYDRLSGLGHAQARRLGDWMRNHEGPFDQVLCGSMRRHRETAKGMGYAPDHIDARLNEMEYFALVRDMEVNHGIRPPASSEDFADHMTQTLNAWEQTTIAGAEPFSTFETRIQAAVSGATKPGKRVLCITSAGVIAMVMRGALGLSIEQMAHVLLPIYNSSLHRFRIRPEGTFLLTFNGIPHLDAPDLADQRTHL
ncbi:histidine phosphatase family protein [Thalassorhabdomicrobium marinisediminis]|uniref:Histidine phosphatase family protein n=1 Tax=Thalassorhabdomicrobium marinisediminis TaxID=2170577 RepID=A0A2T7FT10_9RHOB|nr:histidine phosphatase family protein [Thalassorhabdomicrobium marinisediminis]PVA05309.1 histidine phosphatase family protein [Thalassorhabdomicrobium marinisediminis]